MSERDIYITEQDSKRLFELINDPSKLDRREPEYLDSLKTELTRAKVVAPTEIPPDVITMNSTVRLVDLDTDEEELCTLVFPADADVSQGKISVMAPIGTAMLGYKVGDTFSWRVPGGERRLYVKEITYQPEAAGDYHL